MCSASFWALLEIWGSRVSLKHKIQKIQVIPFPEADLAQGEMESRGGPRWPRAVAEKPLESEPEAWLKVLALRLIRFWGNIAKLPLASAFSFEK